MALVSFLEVLIFRRMSEQLIFERTLTSLLLDILTVPSLSQHILVLHSIMEKHNEKVVIK